MNSKTQQAVLMFWIVGLSLSAFGLVMFFMWLIGRLGLGVI